MLFKGYIPKITYIKLKYNRSAEKGDLLNWDESDWDLHNLSFEEEDVSVADLCTPVAQGLVLFPHRRNMSSAAAVCRWMRAEVAESSSQQMMRLQAEIVRNHTMSSDNGR